jgi:DNA-binding NtrC family response regulator
LALIVLVDDEPVLRTLMHRALSEAGHRVYEASNSREAIALLYVLNRPVRLTIVDLKLPDRRGNELAAEIHREQLTKSVLLTSGDHSLIEELEHQGTNGWAFLSKPFTPQFLVSTVQSILEAPARSA